MADLNIAKFLKVANDLAKEEKYNEAIDAYISSQSAFFGRLTAYEIDLISKSIVQIICFGPYHNKRGSGIIVNSNTIYTNAHIIDVTSLKHCLVLSPYFKPFIHPTITSKYIDSIYSDIIDFAVIKIDLSDIQGFTYMPPNHCVEKIPIGTPIYIFGHPESGRIYSEISGEGRTPSYPLIVTEGIISGEAGDLVMDKNKQFFRLFPNYFTSAKIDLGNSGGLAVVKFNNQICSLGIATWLQKGGHETMGIIQPFQRILDIIYNQDRFSFE